MVLFIAKPLSSSLVLLMIRFQSTTTTTLIKSSSSLLSLSLSSSSFISLNNNNNNHHYPLSLSLSSSSNNNNKCCCVPSLKLLQHIPYLQQQHISLLCTSNQNHRIWRITMDDETKKRKRAEIESMKKEKQPVGLFAKVKYYVKRYWYIAVPVHFVTSLFWFGAFYAAVRSGIDIVSLLEHLHLPETLIDKVKQTPPSAGVLVLTFILFKIASPLRYASTLAGIQIVFSTLKRIGKLPIAKEVAYEIRSKYEDEIQRIGRRYHKHSKFGVRAVKKRTTDDVSSKKTS